MRSPKAEPTEKRTRGERHRRKELPVGRDNPLTGMDEPAAAHRAACWEAPAKGKD
jgi:hypothetical protein